MSEDQLSRKKKDVELEKRMISILQSGNTSAILSTIKDIRNNGRTTVLPEIFNLLQETEDNEVLGACTELINDLKKEDAVPYLVSAIKDKTLKDIRHHIVSSCWQNGLNYSDHLDLFIDLVIKDDYLVAIEAFTLIENHLMYLDEQRIDYIQEKLSNALNRSTSEKKDLISELLDVIKNY